VFDSLEHLVVLVDVIIKQIVIVDKVNLFLLFLGEVMGQIKLEKSTYIEYSLAVFLSRVSGYQELIAFFSLFFRCWHRPWAKRAHLNQVDVQVRDHHFISFIWRVLSYDTEVVIDPIFTKQSLLGTVTVRDITAVHNLCLPDFVNERDPDAGSLTHAELKLAVIAIPECRVHLILLP